MNNVFDIALQILTALPGAVWQAWMSLSPGTRIGFGIIVAWGVVIWLSNATVNVAAWLIKRKRAGKAE